MTENQSLITQGYAPDDLIVTMGLWYGENQIMSSVIPLIDKGDNFEKIRDRIAAILAAETALQQTAATAIGKDPDLWKFRVYSERSNPWENVTGDDKTPVINVWFDNSTYDPSASNISTRQRATSRYNVDLYCHAEAYQTSDGHAAGDELSAKMAHNTAKLVRNILMHETYTYLLYRGIVWKRWINAITVFQPASGGQSIERVIGCRIALDVDHNEEIDIETPETLDSIGIKFYHEPDGQIIAELEYAASE